jgi:hypothetical protein
MKALLQILFLMVMAVSLSATAFSQTVNNPRLTKNDLNEAKEITQDIGGTGAQLTYATRIDAIEKGRFDTLVVVYSKPVDEGEEFFGVVVQKGRKYPLKIDDYGRALNRGERFMKLGLRHEMGKPPLLRVIGSIIERGRPGAAEKQHNVDYQFNGTQFALVGQSVVQSSN